MLAWHRWVQHLQHSRAVRVTTWFATLSGLVYGLWRERNCRTFRGSMTSAELVEAHIVHMITGRILALNVKGRSTIDRAFLATIR